MRYQNEQKQTACFLHTQKIALQIGDAMPGSISCLNCTPTEIILRTSSKHLRAVAVYLRNHSSLRFATLTDIATCDKMHSKGRFTVNYIFTSTYFANRVFVELFAQETSTIASLANPFFLDKRVFASAGWLEREVWDMFGIFFDDNDDLRRILTDYGFNSHPLRRDFPLSGFQELFYDDTAGRVISVDIELAQEMRVMTI